MLTTFNRTEWREDSAEERKRNVELDKMTPDELRKMFPYQAVTKRRLIAYQIPEGEVIKFVRTRREMGHFPLEGVIGVGDAWGRYPRKIHLSSEEVQLLEV